MYFDKIKGGKVSVVKYLKKRKAKKGIFLGKAISVLLGAFFLASYVPLMQVDVQELTPTAQTEFSGFAAAHVAYASLADTNEFASSATEQLSKSDHSKQKPCASSVGNFKNKSYKPTISQVDMAEVPVQLLEDRGKAELEGLKAADNLTPSPGEIVTYTITIKNNGTAASGGLWVKDDVPENTTFVSCDPSGVYGATTAGKEYVNWFIAALAPGDQVVLSMKVKINECSSGTAIENTALYEEADSFPRNPDLDPGEEKTNSVTLITEGDARHKLLSLKTGDKLFIAASLIGLIGIIFLLVAIFSYRKRKRR